MIHEFIKTYPELVATAFAFVISCLLAVLGLWVGFVKHRIEGHIKREEEGIWPKIEARFESMTTKMYELHHENIDRYTNLADEVSQVREKIPNGEISEIKRLLERVLEKVDV